MYNQEKLERGRSEGNVLKYLVREIETSKKLFQASASISEEACEEYFEESVLQILANGDRQLLREEG